MIIGLDQAETPLAEITLSLKDYVAKGIFYPIIGDVKDHDKLFRIFQEALTNVARHARASRVRTHLHQRNGALELEVQDDGRGITPEQLAAPRSFGLISMRERAHSWGGRIDILGRPSEGTSVRVTVPTRLAE